ncbi:MAG: D-glycerate dehydrogenase [Thermoanaerobaculia bacterium]
MTGKRVLVLADLPGQGVERLAELCDVEVRPQGVESEDELAELVPGVHGLLTLLMHRVGEKALSAADSLEAVANCAVGVDNIDLEAARRHDVVVTNTPGVLTEDTADLTWALILSVLRGVVSGDRFLRRGDFRGWRPQLLLGRSLQSVVLGVVGAGRIGQAVLHRAAAFGVRTLYASRSRLPEERERVMGTEWRELAALLAESDVVSLHLPLNEETRHLMDRRRLAAMKPGSVLVNTARGPLVDEAALAAALAAGHLAGAGLDVYEHEPRVDPDLLLMENVVLLPHLGSATRETRIRMADCCCEDLITVLVEGQRPQRDLACNLSHPRP